MPGDGVDGVRAACRDSRYDLVGLRRGRALQGRGGFDIASNDAVAGRSQRLDRFGAARRYTCDHLVGSGAKNSGDLVRGVRQTGRDAAAVGLNGLDDIGAVRPQAADEVLGACVERVRHRVGTLRQTLGDGDSVSLDGFGRPGAALGDAADEIVGEGADHVAGLL